MTGASYCPDAPSVIFQYQNTERNLQVLMLVTKIIHWPYL